MEGLVAFRSENVWRTDGVQESELQLWWDGPVLLLMEQAAG